MLVVEGCTKLAQSSLESLEVNWDVRCGHHAACCSSRLIQGLSMPTPVVQELERDYHAEVTKIHRDAVRASCLGCCRGRLPRRPCAPARTQIHPISAWPRLPAYSRPAHQSNFM
jgi:hypothetical protein